MYKYRGRSKCVDSVTAFELSHVTPCMKECPLLLNEKLDVENNRRSIQRIERQRVDIDVIH